MDGYYLGSNRKVVMLNRSSAKLDIFQQFDIAYKPSYFYFGDNPSKIETMYKQQCTRCK